jgi:micrococcal nuclease
MHEYKVKIIKVIDGDTVDVEIDLGFGIWLHKERVRIMGIDTPESRTSDKVEKVFGLLAKERLSSLLGDEAVLETQVSKKGEDMKGKFGRVLGNFRTINGEHCAKVLIREGHAVAYEGGSKEAIQEQHLHNRRTLVATGKAILPPGLTPTKSPLVTKPYTPEPNDPPNQKVFHPGNAQAGHSANDKQNAFENRSQGIFKEVDTELAKKVAKAVAESDDVTGKTSKKSTDATDEIIAKLTTGEATARTGEKPAPAPAPTKKKATKKKTTAKK